jgi:hypothetical protein
MKETLDLDDEVCCVCGKILRSSAELEEQACQECIQERDERKDK